MSGARRNQPRPTVVWSDRLKNGRSPKTVSDNIKALEEQGYTRTSATKIALDHAGFDNEFSSKTVKGEE